VHRSGLVGLFRLALPVVREARERQASSGEVRARCGRAVPEGRGEIGSKASTPRRQHGAWVGDRFAGRRVLSARFPLLDSRRTAWALAPRYTLWVSAARAPPTIARQRRARVPEALGLHYQERRCASRRAEARSSFTWNKRPAFAAGPSFDAWTRSGPAWRHSLTGPEIVRSHSVPALSWGVAWPATSCFCQQTLSSMDLSARLTQPSAASQGTSVARSLSVCWYGAGSPPRLGSSPAAFCSCFRGHSLWSAPARTSLAAPRPGSEVHPPGQRPARTSLAAPRFEPPDRHATRAPHAQPHPVPIRPS
jgi:hypothetical protein